MHTKRTQRSRNQIIKLCDEARFASYCFARSLRRSNSEEGVQDFKRQECGRSLRKRKYRQNADHQQNFRQSFALQCFPLRFIEPVQHLSSLQVKFVLWGISYSILFYTISPYSMSSYRNENQALLTFLILSHLIQRYSIPSSPESCATLKDHMLPMASYCILSYCNATNPHYSIISCPVLS